MNRAEVPRQTVATFGERCIRIGGGVLLAWLVAFAGCATTPSHASRPGESAGGTAGTGIDAAPAKDKVLWQFRAATTALRRGQFEEAKTLFDDALLTVGASSAGDKEARKARGYFHEEARKVFRGEPYERVMANYYRGIIYWMNGEPDNARASFRNAQFQDSDAENKAYASDYVLLDYLDGFVTARLGGDGNDAFQRAQANVKSMALPPYAPSANTMFFVEYGLGPTKYASGEYGEQLRFRTPHSQVRSAQLRMGDQIIRLPPHDDLSYQATTRGGRVMDHVLANKAVFKSTTDALGTAALLSGAVVASNRHTQEAGLGLLAAGLLTKIVSAAATPAADTRSWDNLPRFLSFAALELPPGAHTATVEFLDAAGMVVPRLTKTVSLSVAPKPRDTVVFVSDQSSSSRPL